MSSKIIKNISHSLQYALFSEVSWKEFPGMCDHFLISPVGQTHALMHTQIIVKKYVMCISRGNKHGAPGVYFHVWHVKEIDLSKQGCVLNEKVERAWEGFLSRVVASGQQPLHPGAPRRLPINASLHFCLSLQRNSRRTPGTNLLHLSASPDRGTVPPRCPRDRGLRGSCWLPCICFVTSARASFHALWLSRAGFFFCCAFNPCSLLLPQLRALRPQRAPPPGLPPLPLPSSRTVRG